MDTGCCASSSNGASEDVGTSDFAAGATLSEPSLLQMLAQRVPDEMALPILESCLEVLGWPRKAVYTMEDVIAIGQVLTEAAALMLDEGLGILEDEWPADVTTEMTPLSTQSQRSQHGNA